jgi:hypothetical protein
MRRAVAVAFAVVVVAVVRAPCPSSRGAEAMGTRGWRIDANGEAVPRGSEEQDGEEWGGEDDEEEDWEEEEEGDEGELVEDPMGEAMKRFWQAKRDGLL